MVMTSLRCVARFHSKTKVKTILPLDIHIHWWQTSWQSRILGKDQRTWIKTSPSATLSTTNTTWTDLGVNPGFHSERSVTNLLSNGKTLRIMLDMFNKLS
jgi:hypothetical protein